jgi:hypothetical protein
MDDGHRPPIQMKGQPRLAASSRKTGLPWSALVDRTGDDGRRQRKGRCFTSRTQHRRLVFFDVPLTIWAMFNFDQNGRIWRTYRGRALYIRPVLTHDIEDAIAWAWGRSEYLQSKDGVFGLDHEAGLPALWNADDAGAHLPSRGKPGDECTFDCPKCGNELIEACKTA